MRFSRKVSMRAPSSATLCVPKMMSMKGNFSLRSCALPSSCAMQPPTATMSSFLRFLSFFRLPMLPKAWFSAFSRMQQVLKTMIYCLFLAFDGGLIPLFAENARDLFRFVDVHLAAVCDDMIVQSVEKTSPTFSWITSSHSSSKGVLSRLDENKVLPRGNSLKNLRRGRRRATCPPQ